MENTERKINIMHTCMNVSGAIKNAKSLKGCIEENGETLETVAEIRACLNRHLAAGRRVLPLCDCLGFSFQTGCPGHSEADAKRHKAIMKIARAICTEEQTCKRWCGLTDDCEAYRAATKIYEERQNGTAHNGGDSRSEAEA